MKVEFLNLYKQTSQINTKIYSSIKKNIERSQFINGIDVSLFEREFAKYLNIKYCLGVGNGTDALEIAIKTLKLRKNSEIIVPANTWISTAEAVINNNLNLKFVDVDKTHNICTKDLEKKISQKTSAIIVVHLYGNPANIDVILKLCRKKKIKIIEDCAQSHGAEFRGKKMSTFGDIGTFSFFPSKNLGGFGDGGCLVTNNKKYFINAKKISNHGGLKKNSHLIIGRNSRLDNIQAGILRIKLKQLNKWIHQRQKQASLYFKLLSRVKYIEFISTLKKSKSSFHLFVIKLKKRNKLKKFLEKKGIKTNIHYPKSLPELKVFKKKHYGYCKHMDTIKINKQILSLPIGEHLKKKEIYYVCKNIKLFFNE
jgi:dTDP-4-amino-4,6-dideoxygalactose transaminase